jgi:hypothetical protein
MCDILSWLTRLPNVDGGEPSARTAISGYSYASVSHPATPWITPKKICSHRKSPLLVKTQKCVVGYAHAALNLREKAEPSTPTPRDPSLSLQAGSVPSLEERGRAAGGIELERCPVRSRSREKHPVRGPRQSADSRQVTRDGTIMYSRKGIGVRHTWEPSFRVVDLRGVAELSISRGIEERKFAWWAQEKARSIGGRVGPRYGGT